MVARNVLTAIIQVTVSEQAFTTLYIIKHSHIKKTKEIRVGGYFIIIIHSLLFIFRNINCRKTHAKTCN